MYDFVEEILLKAREYGMTDLENKLKNISDPEDVPYLRVAIISDQNRLPNLIVGENVMPEKLITANQESVCITFDGSDDKDFKTLHAHNERWEAVPIRFYVIVWDKAFYDGISPCKALDGMDVMIFGMDAAAAFRRSMIDAVTATRVWDALIVIEGLENVSEEESDEFIQVCLRRTENLNMNSQQLVLWDNRVSDIAYEQIASRILSMWQNDETGRRELSEFRREKHKENCERWVNNEVKAALQSKIKETREKMNAEREKLHVNRQIQERCQQAGMEMDHWISEFGQELKLDMDNLKNSIKEKNARSLDSIPITQNTIQTVVENTKEQWKVFVEHQYRIMEISLLSKINEIRMKYNMPENMNVNSFDKTVIEADVSAPEGIWYSPVLLAGVGVASVLCTGLGITILLAFPVLKIKQLHDKKAVMKKLEESSMRIGEEMEIAFHKDLESCKRNVVYVFEQELVAGTQTDMENIRYLTKEMKDLCDWLDKCSTVL
ncbi:MAG: hypothetical protein LUI87_15595 [Lachnospiraceae bacterium]|nr:hypothetical protein [Lachnospiraceae bacterium]